MTGDIDIFVFPFAHEQRVTVMSVEELDSSLMRKAKERLVILQGKRDKFPSRDEIIDYFSEAYPGGLE